MTPQRLLELLSEVERGTLSAVAASDVLGKFWVEEVDGYARLDHGRTIRTGLPEVLFAASKTPEQAAEIFVRMAGASADGDVLATRASGEHAAAILARTPEAVHHPLARTLSLTRSKRRESPPSIAILCAGTSDLPIAEEAAVTAELFGNRVTRLYDVGVAGLHRLLAVLPQLQEAAAIIVCAGMEGALPSVVGGLVGVPVLAVPTSVGYGASFGGVTALLGMLNSCSPNVSVVNIDNGFGAAYTATLIARGGR